MSCCELFEVDGEPVVRVFVDRDILAQCRAEHGLRAGILEALHCLDDDERAEAQDLAAGEAARLKLDAPLRIVVAYVLDDAGNPIARSAAKEYRQDAAAQAERRKATRERPITHEPMRHMRGAPRTPLDSEPDRAPVERAPDAPARPDDFAPPRSQFAAPRE